MRVTMTRLRVLLVVSIVAIGIGAMAAGGAEFRAAQSGPRPSGTNYKGPAFTFNKIADGVYLAIGTGSLVVMSNAVIVEGDHDVLVVDSHVTPGGAWALREELKTVTPKPIRYVVNSHYHFDHSHGNQIYGPEVEIIGHEFARQQILAGKSIDSPAHEFFVGGIPAQIKMLEQRLAAATDDKARETIQAQLDVQRNHLEGTKAVRPTPPTATLTTSMALYRGAREIRLIHLGRGHTAGDVVVFLPKERVVATGDLLTEQTLVHGRRILYRVDPNHRGAEEARVRHRAAGPRPRVPGQGQAGSLAGVSPRLLGAGAEVPQGRHAVGGGRQAGEPDGQRGELPVDQGAGHHPQPRHAARLRDSRRQGEVSVIPLDPIGSRR